jgi:apolipoprotein D and lipocalin family protein
MKLSRLYALLTFSALFAGCAASHTPLKTVSHVDLPRYMGDWFVIANIPYFAEKDCVDSIESYALRSDGKIANSFRFRKRSFDAPQQRLEFVAHITNHRTNAEWRVQFAPLISAGYYIIDVDPTYRWTVVGHPSRRYGWIMARSKTLPNSVYQSILRRLQAQGYDPMQFVKVPQFRSQIRPEKS